MCTYMTALLIAFIIYQFLLIVRVSRKLLKTQEELEWTKETAQKTMDRLIDCQRSK